MPESAYTLGLAESYDFSLETATTDKPVFKVGRRDEYDGGWIWATPYEAISFRWTDAFPDQWNPVEFAVYELALPTNWEVDVSPEPHPDDGVHRLLHDAPIVRRWMQ